MVQWARGYGKYISVFINNYNIWLERQLHTKDYYDVLHYEDDLKLLTYGLFFYAQRMPVIVTRNQLIGAKAG